ncbi:MAG: zinc dependent phospholipase C family protein [Nitrospirae bacterium]|nr:zinc dependent phospholipase C family protein [Nitrospirota bacterium]MBI4838828.1 zinc dependent phospholipase C family protein [Nitrospirota bacterium]
MFIVCLLSFLLLPSIVHAWGPLTHVYLGNQIIDFGAAALPPAIYGVIKKFKNDFLYGNLSADIILGRKFQGFEKNSHSWDIAWKLLEFSKTDRQKAFAYGYLTHLCADSVVHNLKGGAMPFKHSIMEVKSDSMVNRKYRKMLKDLDAFMQKKNDVVLEDHLESLIFSFKTNKKIFKGFLLLSRLPNYRPVSGFIKKRFPYGIPVVDIYDFQQESLRRMFELLKNGRDSDVLKEHPLGSISKRFS